MTTPPGWHPQPDGRERYWNGDQWTEHFRAAAPLPPPPPPASPGSGVPSWAKAAGLLFGGFLLGLVFGALGSGSDDSGTTAAPPTVTSVATVTQESTVTLTATVTAKPPAESTPPPAESTAPAPAAAISTTEAPAVQITVPDGVGMNYQEAQDLWRAAGLIVGVAEDATGANRLPFLDRNWVVVGQDLTPGSTVETGTVITATVKKYTDK